MVAQDGLSHALRGLKQRYGANIALSDGSAGPEVTFADLVDAAASMQHDLSRTGVPSGGLIAYRSASAFLCARLALSLAPHYPAAPIPANAKPAEVRKLIALLRPAALVLTEDDKEIAGLAGELGIAVLVARPDGADRFILSAVSAPVPHGTPARCLDGAGVVLTTSGTTGAPKLVALDEHRLLLSARNIGRSIALDEADTAVEIMPLHHIHGVVAGLLAPLLAGAKNIIQPSPDPGAFLKTAAAAGARWYTAVPTMHRAILDEARRQPDRAAQCRFRFARSASSALPREVRHGIERVFGCPLVEAYGMTETTNLICTQSPEPAGHSGNVGLPCGVDLEVRGADGAALGAGRQGEIWVKGPSVIDGYLDNPQANAETFDGAWMRTGDIGLVNPDGTVTIVARAKEIVKRGGAQIAPTEIEDVLLDQPGVVDAIAFGVTHPTLGQDLAAAVVIDPASDNNPRLLRAALLDVLSDHKVPSRIVAVEEIPKGPTGKPRRLDMEHLLAGELTPKPTAPQSLSEEVLTALFAEALRWDDVGPDHDFFLSGGDSLSGTSMVLEMNTLLGLGLSPEVLFRYSTPGELAAYIDTLDDGRAKRIIESLHGTETAPTDGHG
ncbi:non-ribosomal peptide synthetase [Sinisalibacter lacisalsi]|uniref:Carrier domain-containing protein n=1 Tax=Sinisalibacter lacisalsi TaxID=1526570 RepID=A0ABQ1QJE8_9RHOB|nr:non-ribosomal peptide synthetase [Sinisalibacter lacisalsi]GGD29887.1 hypothetical protein GCM10011358_12400 [Sinisalibacter lacisalsi]